MFFIDQKTNLVTYSILLAIREPKLLLLLLLPFVSNSVSDTINTWRQREEEEEEEEDDDDDDSDDDMVVGIAARSLE